MSATNVVDQDAQNRFMGEVDVEQPMAFRRLIKLGVKAALPMDFAPYFDDGLRRLEPPLSRG